MLSEATPGHSLPLPAWEEGSRDLDEAIHYDPCISSRLLFLLMVLAGATA